MELALLSFKCGNCTLKCVCERERTAVKLLIVMFHLECIFKSCNTLVEVAIRSVRVLFSGGDFVLSVCSGLDVK